MKKTFFNSVRMACLALSAIAVLGQNAQAAQSSRIAAVVNDEAISFNELNARLKLVMESAGMPDTEDMRQRLSAQIISVLVDESIRMQEAENLKLDVEENEINQGVAALAAQNKMQPDQLIEMLKARGIKTATLIDQIKAQIAWTKVVGRKVRPQVDITERDVQAELDRMKDAIGKTQYLVSEIFLPVEKPEDDRSVRQTALKIKQQAAQDPNNFPRLARQFSRAAGAEQGGDIGWVQQGQLADAMNAALENLSAGQVSAPVRSLTGYHIYLLRNKKQFAEGDIPTEDQVYERLGLQRLERLQNQYFMDLKAASFVDIRL
ncbi:MAG: peptidylprolyl isomerase [Pseudomonadota bacterium]|nr:peptidylprolyl isomerase [Alphaproteobacteria bacterium]MEC7577121.1 peptidylprolyl isomerase [Pseudomonadota bacterium]MEC9235436.1 peptidylprolyl isomerase [Pseudomonadota bacterium]MED5423389.1 peptidylprolyl isomerase [Pseudomonadota bacterium]|tara:strand:+ start:140785 stop:141744 length:960 start_codon:yes stop_codon:yes gene_type:complete